MERYLGSGHKAKTEHQPLIGAKMRYVPAAQVNRAAMKTCQAHDSRKQRRLPGTVATNHGDAVAAVHCERQIPQYVGLSVACCDVVKRKRDLSHVRLRGIADEP